MTFLNARFEKCTDIRVTDKPLERTTAAILPDDLDALHECTCAIPPYKGSRLAKGLSVSYLMYAQLAATGS